MSKTFTEWIDENKSDWKDTINWLKTEKISVIKRRLTALNLAMNDPRFKECTIEEQQDTKDIYKLDLLKKKIFAREVKIFTYMYNNDYDNILIYYEKLQEVMSEAIEFVAEKYSEKLLLDMSLLLKNTHELIKEDVETFKHFKEKQNELDTGDDPILRLII